MINKIKIFYKSNLITSLSLNLVININESDN